MNGFAGSSQNGGGYNNENRENNLRGGQGRFGGRGNEYGAEHTDYVTIPANKCGLVIGKGGETIKNINSITGAHCEVDKSARPDAREKNFVIRGSRESVERAKAMIKEKIGMPITASSGGNGSGYNNENRGNNSRDGYNNYNSNGIGQNGSGYKNENRGKNSSGKT